jgi:anti-sigma factor RsiW
MVDDPDVTREDTAHLEACPECQSRLKTVSHEAGSIATLLAVPDARVDVASAFRRVMSTPAAQPRFGFRLPVFRPGSRPMVLALAAAVAGVALLASAVAVNQRGSWTPNTVTPVPVTVADMQSLSQLADYGTVTWTKQPAPQIVTSASEAATVAGGLQPPTVSNLPPGVSTNVTYAAMPQATAVFTFSADKAAAAAAKQGKTLPHLPAGMDGATLTVTIGPAVGEVFGNLKQPSGSETSQMSLPQLVVGESSAPVATSTQVTVKQLEDTLLAQPGISDQLKAAIKAIGDPSTTLPIPVPVQYATSTTVTIQGVKGVALGDNTGVGSAVIWVKHGVVYAVAGSIKQSDAINIANNLK